MGYNQAIFLEMNCEICEIPLLIPHILQFALFAIKFVMNVVMQLEILQMLY